MKKAYIFRIVNHNGHKEYKRTKCSDFWANNKTICWQFSIQGAKKIIDTLNDNNRSNYYTYGYETINA